MGAKYNVRDLRENTRNSIGRFAIWANCITYSAAPARGLCPYDAHKRTHTMPVMLFSYIYMYICERPVNTRVGANCN